MRHGLRADGAGRGGRREAQEDIDGLRAHGYDDGEIVDIVLAASARSFMSKTLDALGAQVDPEYEDDPELQRLAAFAPADEG